MPITGFMMPEFINKELAFCRVTHKCFYGHPIKIQTTQIKTLEEPSPFNDILKFKRASVMHPAYLDGGARSHKMK